MEVIILRESLMLNYKLPVTGQLLLRLSLDLHLHLSHLVLLVKHELLRINKHVFCTLVLWANRHRHPSLIVGYQRFWPYLVKLSDPGNSNHHLFLGKRKETPV